MRKQILVVTLFMIVMVGCGIEYRDDPRCEKYNYMSFDELRKSVAVEEPREIKEAGKIYVYGDLLLVNEKRKGIHLIDNRDKRNPINKAFIKVLGNLDIAVKDGYLMVDSFMDLVVIDINDLANIKEVSRQKDIFPTYQRVYDYGYYNGCEFDFEKGILLGEHDDEE